MKVYVDINQKKLNLIIAAKYISKYSNVTPEAALFSFYTISFYFYMFKNKLLKKKKSLA